MSDYNIDVKSLSILLLSALTYHLFLATDALAAEKTRFGLSASHAPPLLYRFENQNMPIATGGFLYEVSIAIAEELKVDYTTVIIPRGRTPQELTSGNMDVLCHTSTAWNPPYKNTVNWSKPLYTYKKVLVSKKDIPFSRPEQIQNITIGTLEDFVYPDLEKRFSDKVLFRDDAPSVTANIAKLNGGRLDYIIMSEMEFPFHKSTNPGLKRSSFVLDTMDIRCALSRKSSLSIEKLNSAIDRLKTKGTIQKIFNRYANSKRFPRPVVYGLNNNDSPPFIISDTSTESPTIRGGVFFDLALEVGKHLHRPLVFALLPRSRLHTDLAEGKIDMICFDNEIWSGPLAKSFYWSSPIFRQSDHIVSVKSMTEETNINSLKDLKGKIVGTTLNFVYPSLDPFFKDGSVIREDADSGLANVTKLSLDRVQYIVLNRLEFDYYKKSNPRLQKAPMDIDPIDVKCAISRRSDLKLRDLNAAILEMKKSGRMEKVFTQ
ncbi:substrate-binding periplasmic protein [Bdellovibrio sp. HCB337]|uniref:substrate-binding periplasmic protein n=1 Tax=Bdellovibrio sp. HCB337 TaxID=3394358 RepID=UPI0039A6E4CE